MAGQYDPLADDIAHIDDSRDHVDHSDGSSDVSYRDNLDDLGEKQDERFQDEPRMEQGDEDGIGYAVDSRRLRPRKKSKKILAVLIIIVVLAGLIGTFSAWAYSAPAYFAKSGNRHMVMDHVFNGTFNARSKYIDWVKEAQDGTFSHQDEHGNIVLSTVDSMNISSVLVNASLVLDSTGHRLYWNSFSLSADMQYVLLRTDYVKQWRYSSHANYWIHRLSDSSSFPLLTPTDPPTTAYAKWSPVSHSIAYVSNNDLYVIRANELGPGMKSIRVTDDGSASVFNGVPDWVYEEEVLSGDYALWWSPDAQSIAYLRSDESAVHDYTIQYYNPTNDAFTVHQYLSEMDMKYPKPGTPNPLVTVHTFSLATYQTTNSVEQAKKMLHWKGEMPVESRIISEVAWVAQDALLVKEIDRAARVGNVVLFQYGETDGKVVRTLGANGEEGEGGWIDHDQNVIPVANGQSGYLDIVPKDGYNHIALFSPLQSGEPIWLTEGEWEVTSIAGFDPLNNLVYFVAANPSIDRHLHSAVLPTSGYGDFNPQIVALTDTSQPGYYDVLFSPGARYYLLSYKGPEVPWQRLMETGEEGVNVLMEGNAELNVTLAEFMRPIVTRTTIESDGYELNMQIMTPPNFDTSGRKKYPVLIRVYGGPGSQMVNNMWGRDWHTYLACEKKYIIVLVDGRGTGFKGRKLRNPVTDDLGRWEVVDQVAGAREMAKRVYVDRTRIGIWGWSYGGYMTCKTVEADSGIFTLGMAVAPVTDWMYYDSIYTERYMSTPEQNPEGYHSSAVNNMTAFGKVDFLLAHGSGDDNVHFMNSATLLDKLTQSGINGWRFRMFTDSNHSMDKRNGYRQVFEWMNVFLEEKWGKGGTVHH